MNEAAMADRVLIINDGTLLMDGTPDEVFSKREILQQIGLEVPQCTALVDELRKLGFSIEGDTISTPDGCAAILSQALMSK